MKIEASKKIILIFALSITTALLTGGIIGEQLSYLHAFYAKHIAHWGIGMFIFVVSLLISTKKYKGSSLYSTNIGLIILLLLTSILGFDVVLNLHEYTHLSYLLSYLIFGISGRFMAIYLPRLENNFSLLMAISSIIIGVLVGAVWRFLNWDNNLYFYFIILTIVIYTFLLYKIDGVFKAASIIFLVPIFFLIKMNVEPHELSRNQSKYTDRVVFSKATKHHQIDITLWRGNYWFYYDEKVQFSSVDEVLYSEAMVHPLMQLLERKKKVLVVGGENGIIVRELLKYNTIEKIDIHVLDAMLYKLGETNSLFTKVNQNSLNSEKIREITAAILKSKIDYYDAIFIDAPDPSNDKWNAFYTKEFYNECQSMLSENGFLITQAGNPYLSSKAFTSIEKTIQSADFNTLAMHNQILTLGEWGWIIASKSLSHESMKTQLSDNKGLDSITYKWINQEALNMLVSFGKKTNDIRYVEINSTNHPILIEYYLKGNYQFE